MRKRNTACMGFNTAVYFRHSLRVKDYSLLGRYLAPMVCALIEHPGTFQDLEKQITRG